MQSRVANIIIMSYHLFCEFVGSVATIILACFLYLSDYLQIKRRRAKFIVGFWFFKRKRSVCVLTRSICVLTQSVCVLTQSVCVLTRSVCVLTRSVCVLTRSVCAFICYTCALICYSSALICYSSALICCNSALMRYTSAFIRNACVRMRYTCVVMYNTCERVRNSCAFARCCEKLSLNIGTFSSAYYNGRLKKMALVHSSNKSGKPLFFSGFS